MKNKSASHLILTALFAVLILAASNSIVRAECPGTSNWIGGTGSWFDGENWSNGCVPTSTIDATINNDGKAQIQGATAAAESLILGDDQGDTGSVTVDGASAVLDLGNTTCRGTIYIGNRGIGNLDIGSHGTIRSRYAYVAAVANPDRPASNGTVHVKGSGALWYLYDNVNEPTCTGAGLCIGCGPDGNGGTATVDVSDGGIIAVYNNKDAPGVTVGLSGTLTGNGVVYHSGATGLSETTKVYGTLAPGRSLEIRGNLDLRAFTANTVCQVNPQVTPQPNDKVYVSSTTGGGTAYLGGRLTVMMSGTFTAGMGFTLVHADTLRDGFFQHESFVFLNSLGPCLAPTIQYGAHDVNLVIVSTCAESEP